MVTDKKQKTSGHIRDSVQQSQENVNCVKNKEFAKSFKTFINSISNKMPI